VAAANWATPRLPVPLGNSQLHSAQPTLVVVFPNGGRCTSERPQVLPRQFSAVAAVKTGQQRVSYSLKSLTASLVPCAACDLHQS
jgi:hypothetical protein